MLDKIRDKFRPAKLLKLKSQKGQSLVEMAIAAPLLLIMFLGVFEVGWALRGYIVLANVNRESARFAVKNSVLDYSEKNPATVGYNIVLSHTAASLSAQLPLEFQDSANTTVIMSHVVADTGLPCAKYQGGKPKVPYEFDAANCNCTEDDPNAAQWFTRDDLVLHPDIPGQEYYAQTYGISRTTRLGNGSYAALAEKLALENNQFNCTVLKTGSTGEMSINNMFIAEAFYDQPQIFGVPFISNRLTDPIPFYTHTAMRIVTSRDADTSDTIGPTCEVYPITFHDGIFDDPDHPIPGQAIDAFQGSGTGQFGWLTWNPDPSHNNAGYAYEELLNPRLSMTDFTDANEPDDHSLSIGADADDVSSGPGVMNSNDIDDALEGLVGKTIRVPIYHAGGGTGQNTYYTISHFALIKINQVCLPRNSCPGVSGNDKRINATFVGYDDEACTEGSSGSPGGGGGGGNSDPVANDDTVTTDKDTPINIAVLSNDNDPDGDTITIDSFTNPAKGTVVDNGDGTLKYTPKNNASGLGTWTFNYTISDGNGGTATATVTVNVTSTGNTPPVAQNDSGYSTGKGTPLIVAAGNGVLVNDTDANGDTLTAMKVSDPAHGSVSLNGNGSFTYTPNGGFFGTDTFTYKANDGAANSNVATVTITVTGNNAPTADNKSVTTPEDTAVNVTLTGSDSDNDPLTYSVVAGPSHGTLSGTAPNLTYTPNPNWNGTDTFTYKANDGTADSAVATVTIVVNPVNDPPVAVNDSYAADLGVVLNVNAATGVLTNDTDPDTVVLHAVLDSGPSNGSLTLNDDGSFTYTGNTSGTDSFTYHANDGTNDSNVATVNIAIQAAALTIIASDDFASGDWSGGGGNPGWSGAWNVNDNKTDVTSGEMRLRKYGEASRTVNMSGVTGASLSFQWRADSLDGSESAEVSIDDGSGAPINVLTVYNGEDDNNNHTKTVDLSGYNMTSTFQIIFKINGSGNQDYFYIDDIEITGYR